MNAMDDQTAADDAYDELRDAEVPAQEDDGGEYGDLDDETF